MSNDRAGTLQTKTLRPRANAMKDHRALQPSSIEMCNETEFDLSEDSQQHCELRLNRSV
jgi:hypothetical protein